MTTALEPSFGRHIITCLATALSICAAVELACLSLGIAPFFTPNLLINEKMRFLREHRPGSTPIAVVSGASIALNDIDSDLLQDEERHPFVNLGADGVSVPTSEDFYKQFASLYPVSEVIFAASPVEMRDVYRSDVKVSNSVFRSYVLGRMSMAEEFTYRDIPGLMSYWENWSSYHSRTSPASMEFTKTGAVPLEIDVRAEGSRAGISEALDLSPHCTYCMSDLSQFCQDVRKEGLPFTIVLGPVLPSIIERDARVRTVIADRKEQFRAVAERCNGQLFDITDYATLDDSCFANSLHLNAQGMSVMTAQLESFRRGELISKGKTLTCGSLNLATMSATGPK
jgi:hypothetical protein